MKKHYQLIVGLALTLVVLLSACGTNVPAASNTPEVNSPVAASSTPEAISVVATITNTPDPCAPENIEAEVMKVHQHMREFDDVSALTASLTHEELSKSITELQRIRRESEDQVIPYCLGDLKTYQISHMNVVINTLIAFLGMSDEKDKENVNKGIALARQLHDQYTLELARVLGLTVEAAPTAPAVTETPAPGTPTTP